MTIEATLDDTVILTAYTEGYLTTQGHETIKCPYEIGTREFDIWILGSMHRRCLGPEPVARRRRVA